jgi:hypothetical protein
VYKELVAINSIFMAFARGNISFYFQKKNQRLNYEQQSFLGKALIYYS